MSHNDTEMRQYYARRYQEYDRIYLKPERQRDLRAIEAWLPNLFTDADVLEIACGTGYWTQFIAPHAKRVVAVDASIDTMSIARDRPGCRQVEFIEGDAYALPLAGHRFDAAFAGFWFSHVPIRQRREFLLGLHAVLNRGARIVLLDNLFVAGSSTPLSETEASGDTFQIRRLDDGTTHRVLKNFPSQEEMLALVSDIGTSPRLTAWQHYWAFDYLSAT